MQDVDVGKVRLCIMMFLQFFVWGVFFVTMGTYFSKLFAGEEGINTIVGQSYATQTWAALFAPLIVGFLGDRLMNKEQLNGILHLIGAAIALVGQHDHRLDDSVLGAAGLLHLLHADVGAGQHDHVSKC